MSKNRTDGSGNYCFTVLGGKSHHAVLPFLYGVFQIGILFSYFLSPVIKWRRHGCCWRVLDFLLMFWEVLMSPSYAAPPSLSLFLFIYWFCLLFLLRPHWPCDDCSLRTTHMVMTRKRTDKQLKCRGNFYSSIAKKECAEKKVWAPTANKGNSKGTRNLDFLNKNEINSQPVYNFQPVDASVTTGACTNLNPVAYGR